MVAVSIVIPTFNRANRVLDAVASVFSQEFLDYEIIVVDDGSSDGTFEALSSCNGKIRFYSHPENKGVSAARNTGIKVSKAPLIAFLDSDDRWLPKKLGVQVAFFRDNPEALICQTQEIWIRKGRRVNPRDIHKKTSGDIFLPSLRRCMVSPSAVMMRRSLLEEVGLFDEDLPACEDYDLWLRIGCRYPVYLIDEFLVVREGGHTDQLSCYHTGMDRFRIQSLVKIVQSGILSEEYLFPTIQELELKCRIYGEGCIKRGRVEEGRYYLSLPGLIKKSAIKSSAKG